MAQYRKKPVVIEAVQWDGDHTNGIDLPAWFREPLASGGLRIVDGYKLEIGTLEGTMTADIGDMVIRGVKGEIYPCKPDIFAATYEAV